MSAGSTAGRAGHGLAVVARWSWRIIRGEVVRRVGGPARARVILLFAAVLALSSADTATVGSVAPQLEHSLHIGNTKIGLLSSVTLIVGAIFTLPVGMLVDRIRRIPLLAASILLWSVASVLSAFAGSYGGLLLTRLLLGAVTATAGPVIASLTGDYFPSVERARVYAYILGGEIAGTAAGFIISGSVASAFSWRVPFILLAIPGVFIARNLWRTVPEPARGGASRLQRGVIDLEQAVADGNEPDMGANTNEAGDPPEREHDLAAEAVRQRGVEPDPERILHRDPRTLPIGAAVRYVLSIPSNVMLIIGSSLGYFFFSGLQTFAVLFVRGHYHTGQATAELVLAMLVAGAMVGTLASGRLTDLLVKHGALAARAWVPGVCYVGAAILLIPGFVSSQLTPALWFDVAGAALLSAANPPLDAARLDIMPAGLWGRAESVRTVARSIAQAVAPVLFGGLSQLIEGIAPAQTPVGTKPGAVTITEGASRGLEFTFLILLVTLAAAGVALFRGRATYPQDVATAAASNQGVPVPSVAPVRR